MVRETVLVTLVVVLASGCPSSPNGTTTGTGGHGGTGGGSGGAGAGGQSGAVGAGGQNGAGGQGNTGGGSCAETQEAHLQCNANSVGLTCSANASPDANRYDCFANYTASGGGSFVCCRVKAAASGCAVDATVACDTGFSGYSCSGTDTPAASSAVVCHQGGVVATISGETQFCCGTVATADCALSQSTTGCGGVKYIFACNGTTPARPDVRDPWLVCGEPIPNFGNTTFCCDVRRPPTITCKVDPNVDCAPTTGYSCTGSDTPLDSDPALLCGTPSTFNGTTQYCCRH